METIRMGILMGIMEKKMEALNIRLYELHSKLLNGGLYGGLYRGLL